MLFLINKYLKNSKNKNTGGRQEDSSVHAGDMPGPCIPGCVPVRANRGKRTASAANDTVTTTTTRASRANFAKSAASSVLPGAHGFTNHESLPGLQDAYSGFAESFPQYDGARQADVIRDEEYQHLAGHVCLDYTGINLFSHAQMNPSDVASTSSAPPPQPSDLQYWQPPFFDIVYKSASLRSQVQCSDRGGGGGLEAAVRRRIMASLKIPEDEYSMVCTANRTTSLRLLAESYRFQTGSKLLTVYDYESEAVAAMSETAGRKGADVASASVAWPSLRVHAPELRKKLAAKRKGRRKTPGLFVFPLVSRMTGARYPYLWMSLARQFGWHVALDACALGNKDLDTFGLSLIRPDFIVCNFFKVFGENPSGFAGLFVKKSSCDALEASLIARSIGIVSIVPARRWSLHDDYSTDIEAHSCKQLNNNNNNNNNNNDDDVDTTSSFSGPVAVPAHHSNAKAKQVDASEPSASASAWASAWASASASASAFEIETTEAEECTKKEDTEMEIACRGLDHADALGLVLIRNRLRCITNWLVIALHKLRHPHADNGHALVRIYGPRVKFDRGPSLAFNVFDWKGEKVEPSLVQKLADRNNVSLSCGFLRNIWFSDEYDAEKNAVLERKIGDAKVPTGKRKESDLGIHVVNASLGFLTNFEDAYKLWAFVAKFLDADFVEKERWRYTALNQKTVEL